MIVINMIAHEVWLGHVARVSVRMPHFAAAAESFDL